LVAALMLALGSGAFAQTSTQRADEMRKDLITIESTASVGLGFVNNDNRRFGQYSSFNKGGTYGLLNLDLITRDEETGTWFKIFGKDLGLANQDLKMSQEKQGDWGWFLQSTQMVRNEPFTVHTGLQGIGTANQLISSTAPKNDINLKVEHDIMALGVKKYVANGFDVRIGFKQDDTNGARMFGRGVTGTQEFLTEPIDRSTRQWEFIAGYADRKMQFSGGYNGSSYANNIPVLLSSGGNAGLGNWNMAMPPSNIAHQLHLAGGYNFSDTTRTSFKWSQTMALQNETFSPVYSAVRLAGAPDNLNGKMSTTLLYTDLSLRPSRDLDIISSLRLEDRRDETPEVQYIAAQAASTSTAGATGFNWPRNLNQLKGKIEASYKLGDDLRLVSGFDDEVMRRNYPSTFRRVGYREMTDEMTGRLELKRSVSDELNGSLSVLRSERRGSEYIPDTFAPTSQTNQVNAILWADRNRDKLRLMSDWMPSEDWSFQLIYDMSQDTYFGRNLGPRAGSATFLSLDANYKINDKWNLTTWLSQENTASQQSQRTDVLATAAAGGNEFWSADLRYNTSAVGMTLKGKPRWNLQLGLELSSSLDIVDANLAKTAGTGTVPVNSLPEIYYRHQTFKLYADYALQAKSGIRVNFTYDHRDTNDWTWTNYTYTAAADGTTVIVQPVEDVVFFGISYYFRWN